MMFHCITNRLFLAIEFLVLATAAASRAGADNSTSTYSTTESYSWAHPRQDWPGWYTVHQWYVDDASNARANDGIQLLFYGDSITQCWRFGAAGNVLIEEDDDENSICWGAPQVFDKHFGSRYNSRVFGIGGDQTPELMYRLLHGEGPEGLNTTVAVLLIGTNDLGYALDKGQAYMDSIVPDVAEHIKQIASFLAARVQHVVLLGIFQRGNWHKPETMFVQPSEFTSAISTINKQLEQYAQTAEQVHYLYCGDAFFTANHTQIDKTVMPDALHPNMAGFELLAECLDATVQRLMESPSTPKDASLQ